MLGKAILKNGNLVSNIKDDILKITVVNRYKEAKPAVAFIHNIGIKSGAIAISVNHDSHNIIAVGTSDEEILKAVNIIIGGKGGVTVVDDDYCDYLPLPVAGIMSNLPAIKVGPLYEKIVHKVHSMGSKLRDPYMTMSFMALLVIPDLKISDMGLFDGTTF